MKTGDSLDWFIFNQTDLTNPYGPWPIFDSLANYSSYYQQHGWRKVHQQNTSPETLGLATGTILVLALASQIKPVNLKNGLQISSRRVVNQLAVLKFLIVVPIITTLLLALAAYKKIVGTCWNLNFLLGIDAIWALDVDENKSKAVINILVTINGNISLEDLRYLVKTRIVPKSEKLSKLRKYSSCGYFYWDDGNDGKLDMNKLVRMLTLCTEGKEITEDELRAQLQAVANSSLPENHAAGWEVLLGPRVRTSPTGSLGTAILFRVHHTLGDGPALMNMLLKNLVDETDSDTALSSRAVEKLKMMLEKNSQMNTSQMLQMASDGFSSILEQSMIPPDSGLLHNTPLNGRKYLTWRSSEGMLDAARRVRTATGAPFTAGLLAALVQTMEEYSIARGAKSSPLTFVLPARMLSGVNFKEDELNNGFAMFLVHLHPLPTTATPYERVKAAETAIKSSGGPSTLLVNGWVLRILGGLLPRSLATSLFYSRQCTAVLSNLPGPENQLSIMGQKIKQIVFWVPHRGTTGFGATALSYAGELTLGLHIDSALLSGPDDAELLAESWERNLIDIADQLNPTV